MPRLELGSWKCERGEHSLLARGILVGKCGDLVFDPVSIHRPCGRIDQLIGELLCGHSKQARGVAAREVDAARGINDMA